jgi:microcystin-dependent protein
MATIVTFNGVNYSVPAYGDTGWAQGSGNLTQYLIALATGSLQQTGGLFTLTADANFGASFGLIAEYYKSESANIASAGVVRLANTDTIDWRNFANTGNDVLAINSSDQLTFNGVPIASPVTGIITPGTQYQLAYYATSGTTLSGNPNTMAATEVVVTDTHGVPTTTGNGGTTATEIGYVHGVTSPIQTQINAFSGFITIPIGGILMWPATSAPSSSFSICDGSAISRSTYSALFSLIGTTFGPGDGSTTFNLPNLIDRFPLGAGDAYALGQEAGSATHVLTTAELPHLSYTSPSVSVSVSNVTDPEHQHTETAAISTGGFSGLQQSSSNSGTGAAVNTPTELAATGITVNTTTTTTTTVSDANGGGSHSILNPFLGVFWIIRII